jgi:uncharacterized protein DUF417
MPNGWAESAGGFPAMTSNVAFLMKDVVLLALSICLLKQDVVRVLRAAPGSTMGHAEERVVDARFPVSNGCARGDRPPVREYTCQPEGWPEGNQTLVNIVFGHLLQGRRRRN